MNPMLKGEIQAAFRCLSWALNWLNSITDGLSEEEVYKAILPLKKKEKYGGGGQDK